MGYPAENAAGGEPSDYACRTTRLSARPASAAREARRPRLLVLRPPPGHPPTERRLCPLPDSPPAFRLP